MEKWYGELWWRSMSDLFVTFIPGSPKVLNLMVFPKKSKHYFSRDLQSTVPGDYYFNGLWLPVFIAYDIYYIYFSMKCNCLDFYLHLKFYLRLNMNVMNGYHLYSWCIFLGASDITLWYLRIGAQNDQILRKFSFNIEINDEHIFRVPSKSAKHVFFFHILLFNGLGFRVLYYQQKF